MGVMAAMLIINPIYSWLVSRIDQNRIIPYIYTFFILNLGLFLFLWSFTGDQGRVMDRKSLLFGLMFILFCSVSILGHDDKFYNHTESKKFFGIISAGGSLGAFFGSSVAKYFSTEICGNSSISDLGPMTLIIFSICSLLFAIYFSRSFKANNPNHQNDEKVGKSSFQALSNIIREPAIRNLGLYVVLFTMLMTTSWMISLGIVQDWSQDPCERTALQYRQIVTPLTLMQLFLASFILETIGGKTVLVIWSIIFSSIHILCTAPHDINCHDGCNC